MIPQYTTHTRRYVSFFVKFVFGRSKPRITTSIAVFCSHISQCFVHVTADNRTDRRRLLKCPFYLRIPAIKSSAANPTRLRLTQSLIGLTPLFFVEGGGGAELHVQTPIPQ